MEEPEAGLTGRYPDLVGRASSGNRGGGGDLTETARTRVESKKKNVGPCSIIATSS